MGGSKNGTGPACSMPDAQPTMLVSELGNTREDVIVRPSPPGAGPQGPGVYTGRKPTRSRFSEIESWQILMSEIQ
jgi:hypothetical protein